MKKKISWKPVLFILANLVFVLILALILQISLDICINESTTMNLMIVLPACLVFLAIGVFLFILGKSYSILLLNKLLPFVSLPAFFLPEVFTGGTTWQSVLAMSIIAAVLIILAIFTTITVLIRNRVKVAAEVTIKEQQPPTGQGIASFTRWGAIGFGFGALAAALPVCVSIFLLNFLSDDFPLRDYLPFFVLYAVMGGIAGALLGIKALNNTRIARHLALAGAVGFGLGAMLPYLIAPPVAEGEIPFSYGFVPGAITGLVGGAALGLALKQWRAAEYLALTGAILFAVAHQLSYQSLLSDILNQLLVLPIEAAIAGAALGATIGYMEKRAN